MYAPNLKNVKETNEKIHLVFSTDNSENYNLPLSLTELKQSLQKSRDSVAVLDYQLLAHLPDTDIFIILLQAGNEIHKSGTFPPSWRNAVVIRISRPGI